jgi:uncharacterized RDD family membrane protein YckC
MAFTDSSTSGEPTVVRYATFTRRARAVLIDSAIVGGSIGALVILGDLASDVPGAGRVAWLLLFGVVVLYEPVLVWRRGATIGHAANQIMIVADGTGRPPSFIRALARYLGKVPLGVFGFLPMATTRRHQALHDMLARTTVQLAPTADADTEDFHVEREDNDDILLPSRARRTFVIVGYVIVLVLAYGRVVTASLPDDCVRDGVCSAGGRLFAQSVFALALVLSAGAVVAGWRGMLPGARARPVASSDAPEE